MQSLLVFCEIILYFKDLRGSVFIASNEYPKAIENHLFDISTKKDYAMRESNFMTVLKSVHLFSLVCII